MKQDGKHYTATTLHLQAETLAEVDHIAQQDGSNTDDTLRALIAVGIESYKLAVAAAEAKATAKAKAEEEAKEKEEAQILAAVEMEEAEQAAAAEQPKGILAAAMSKIGLLA